MTAQSGIYQDIATRTGGDIYIGVVGPVRSGKSTFIKSFMEEIVLPQIEDPDVKKRATDEIPQSGSGRNVMTTEPKFVPDEAVRIEMEDGIGFRVKLIDCVGFTVPGAQGLEENGITRMVNTPWSKEAMPFEEAATIGTEKVIRDHSTIGIVVTTDGSIGEIPRESYLEAEEAVIRQMHGTGKPYVVILNSTHPDSDETKSLSLLLEEKYKVPVLPINCFLMQAEDFQKILKKIVLEFPLKEVFISLPSWLSKRSEANSVRNETVLLLDAKFRNIRKTGELSAAVESFSCCSPIQRINFIYSDLGTGRISLELQTEEDVFYRVLSDCSGTKIESAEELLQNFSVMAEAKSKYERIARALQEVEETGYGIVTPSLEDLMLEEPEIVKQPGGYGVKLKASAPSIHMIRANIQAEISPIVGSERQSEDIVKFLLKEFEEDPKQIWHSNMFGKSLYELVNEGLNTKLNHMPQDARNKFGETLQKIVNEGSGGLICIIL